MDGIKKEDELLHHYWDPANHPEEEELDAYHSKLCPSCPTMVLLFVPFWDKVFPLLIVLDASVQTYCGHRTPNLSDWSDNYVRAANVHVLVCSAMLLDTLVRNCWFFSNGLEENFHGRTISLGMTQLQSKLEGDDIDEIEEVSKSLHKNTEKATDNAQRMIMNIYELLTALTSFARAFNYPLPSTIIRSAKAIQRVLKQTVMIFKKLTKKVKEVLKKIRKKISKQALHHSRSMHSHSNLAANSVNAHLEVHHPWVLSSLENTVCSGCCRSWRDVVAEFWHALIYVLIFLSVFTDYSSSSLDTIAERRRLLPAAFSLADPHGRLLGETHESPHIAGIPSLGSKILWSTCVFEPLEFWHKEIPCSEDESTREGNLKDVNSEDKDTHNDSGVGAGNGKNTQTGNVIVIEGEASGNNYKNSRADESNEKSSKNADKISLEGEANRNSQRNDEDDSRAKEGNGKIVEHQDKIVDEVERIGNDEDKHKNDKSTSDKSKGTSTKNRPEIVHEGREGGDHQDPDKQDEWRVAESNGKNTKNRASIIVAREEGGDDADNDKDGDSSADDSNDRNTNNGNVVERGADGNTKEKDKENASRADEGDGKVTMQNGKIVATGEEDGDGEDKGTNDKLDSGESEGRSIKNGRESVDEGDKDANSEGKDEKEDASEDDGKGRNTNIIDKIVDGADNIEGISIGDTRDHSTRSLSEDDKDTSVAQGSATQNDETNECKSEHAFKAGKRACAGFSTLLNLVASLIFMADIIIDFLGAMFSHTWPFFMEGDAPTVLEIDDVLPQDEKLSCGQKIALGTVTDFFLEDSYPSSINDLFVTTVSVLQSLGFSVPSTVVRLVRPSIKESQKAITWSFSKICPDLNQHIIRYARSATSNESSGTIGPRDVDYASLSSPIHSRSSA